MPILITAEMEAETREVRVVRRKTAETGEVVTVTVRVGKHGTLRFNGIGRVVARRPSKLNLPRFLFQRASSLARDEFQGKIEGDEVPFEGIEANAEIPRPRNEIAEDHGRCHHCGYLDPAHPRPEICPVCEEVWHK